MFAELESYAHRIRQKLSRSEWAIRHLGLTPSEGTAEEPGLLMLQIDGLSRTQLERAMQSGRMPFLRRLMKRDAFELHNFYPGLPTTTPAVQAELYYGVKSAVPAFSFLSRKRKEIGVMYNSDWAKAFEATYQEKATGLLKGGSSWSNIYTGGASPDEAHFCAASIGFGDMWRTGKIRNIFLFILFQFPAVLRIARLLISEIFVALMDVIDGIRHGEKALLELGMAFSRVFIGTGLRELVTIGGKVDLARGLPIIHVNFLSYDEHAHRRGPGSKFAHWSLGAIDRAIKDFFRAAQRSRRRDYSVWIFSDHGQERARSFALEYPGGVEKIIRECLEISQHSDPSWRPRSQRPPQPDWFSRSARARRRMQRSAATNTLTTSEKTTFTVAALGPVGHVYFAQPLDFERRLALAHRLVSQGKIPGVIVFEPGGRKVWVHAKGEWSIPGDIAKHLPHAEPIRAQIAEDLVGFCENENSGDLVLLGWSPGSEYWTFAPERGAHAGLGPEETRGFVLTPPRTRLPAHANDFIRPSALRAAALHHLGRDAMPRLEITERAPCFRLVTYNTHGCSGTDGRVSPRRIARILAAQQPDIIALQELDLGRRRSRAEDQAAIIAHHLGFHAVFCPTVTHGGEHYGHALLSRWPIETIKRSLLPTARGSWVREPRAAIWAKVKIGEMTINLVTTHLGLGREERRLQVEALLGHEWLGAMHPDEPLLICGDFNMMPGSGPYGRLASRLRDVQAARQGHRPLRTFTSVRPFTRIDHVFISPLLETQHVFVPRTHLTRVASDHLPLVVDLQLVSAAVEKPTHSLASR
ncbi:MAG TPA: endonuclease/exonuclease/phosphatase family protein [Opitutaceae bacterium]|nr:endonuclease/exonuclease/phosphatase family protein [Opitutaceae bacterium]